MESGALYASSLHVAIRVPFSAYTCSICYPIVESKILADKEIAEKKLTLALFTAVASEICHSNFYGRIVDLKISV